VNAYRSVAAVLALVGPVALRAQAPDTGGAAVKLSGYVTSSYFYATHPTGRTIVGRLYDRFHDEFMLNAVRVSVEKPIATDKVDAGFRVDALYGQNAPPIRSAGLALGDQGDLPQAFVTLNLPTGRGTYVQFKAGKMWTLLDVEVVDEVLNPNFSEGYQYIYLTNFTNTGFGIDAKLSAKVDAQVRLINGWDVVEDNNAAKSFMGRAGITPSDKVGLAFLGFYGPEQPGNVGNERYGGEFVGTFKPSSPTTIYVQGDVGGEQGLGAGGSAAGWWGLGVWGVFDLDAKVTLALRGDYIDDRDGVRMSGVLGFATAPSRRIGSGTVTLNVKSWPHALVRPEIRLEHSNRDDFGNVPNRTPTQVSFGLALSYIF
jgi:hypothetical protein